MADAKISALDAIAATAGEDLLAIIDDPGGTPADKKVTVDNLFDPVFTTLTSGGTDDYGMQITQTLNDTGAAGGSDVYRAIKVSLTETDVTGWDNVYLLDLNAEVTVDNAGRITVPQLDEAATPTIAFGDGDTGFYEESDDSLVFSTAVV